MLHLVLTGPGVKPLNFSGVLGLRHFGLLHPCISSHTRPLVIWVLIWPSCWYLHTVVHLSPFLRLNTHVWTFAPAPLLPSSVIPACSVEHCLECSTGIVGSCVSHRKFIIGSSRY